jgi:hypothetical protein
MKQHCLLLMITAAAFATSALAKAPALPEGATKLTGAEVRQIYHANAANYNNFTEKVSLSGTTYYDFDKGRMWGFYLWDKKDRGMFMGNIEIKGDEFCYQSDGFKQFCNSVHRHGDDIFEVNAKGVVTSMNKVLPGGAPAVPATAKTASLEDLRAMLEGKAVSTTVFDMEEAIVTRVKWNVKKKQTTGEYIYGGKEKGKFTRTISTDGGKICTKGKKEKQPSCHVFMIDGTTFYEVTDAGAVHAISVRD